MKIQTKTGSENHTTEWRSAMVTVDSQPIYQALKPIGKPEWEMVGSKADMENGALLSISCRKGQLSNSRQRRMASPRLSLSLWWARLKSLIWMGTPTGGLSAGGL